MDTKFQTSFIPKKPMQSSVRASAGINLFLFLSIIIFFVSLGIAGWVFLEQKLLTQQISDAKATVEKNKSSFDSVTIDSLVELDNRINVSKKLLASHTDIAPIFDFLQKATLTNARLKTFSFTTNSSDSSGQSGVGIQLAGEGRDFETVASQADEFGKAQYKNIIKEPKLSGVSPNSDGSVSFSFSAYIIPSCLNYSGSKCGISN